MRSAQTIKVGEVILPPPREISLWMKRALVLKGLSEKALELTVVDIRQGQPDKNGSWLVIKGRYSQEWTKDYAEPGREHFMSFRARPETLWKVIKAL